ncbi:MAG: hypothetical protein RMJ87_10265 [Cytophagales bacterium]|nr:hypothetical protein [Bernardetiaceae bacterium]MDW8205403.1 hypothetical protein [Cytophagales bacterium]
MNEAMLAGQSINKQGLASNMFVIAPCKQFVFGHMFTKRSRIFPSDASYTALAFAVGKSLRVSQKISFFKANNFCYAAVLTASNHYKTLYSFLPGGW